MKKVILSAIAICAFGFANAQSNKSGTIHVNVMGGFLMGSATSQSDVAGSDKYKSTATGANFGAQFQYGLAEKFSAGIGLEFGTAVLTPKDNVYNAGSTDVSTFKVNLSGRYYFLNQDKYNVYAGPSIGYTSGKDTSSAVLGSSSISTKYSGLNYGVNVGGNYFFTDVVGIILNVGYEGNALKSTTSESGFDDETGKATLGGVKIMAGLALKFK
jgi:opacity protein-like surface antigen